MSDLLNIALPKGRLGDKVYNLLESIGYDCREIREDGRIGSVEFAGGCPGNLQGIGKLVSGMKPEEVIERLSGIRCGGKPTSCPDQLARALQAILRKREAR